MKKRELASAALPASFLLAQLGAHAAGRFAERLAPLGLAPPHAGILRMLSGAEGMSQQALAGSLGMHASRLVALLDELEQRGLLERREHPSDRRSHALCLSTRGRALLADIARVAAEHDRSLCAALKPSERAQLASLLQRVADQQGLTRGVHPGYRRLGAARKGR